MQVTYGFIKFHQFNIIILLHYITIIKTKGELSFIPQCSGPTSFKFEKKIVKTSNLFKYWTIKLINMNIKSTVTARYILFIYIIHAHILSKNI